MPPYDKCIIYRPLGVKKLCEEIAARTGAYGAVIVETREWKKVTILGTSRKVSARKAAHILAKAPFSSRKQYIPMAIIRNYVQGKKQGMMKYQIHHSLFLNGQAIKKTGIYRFFICRL